MMRRVQQLADCHGKIHPDKSGQVLAKKIKNEQMKRFSSNITDEELHCLFREAAEHYNPKLNDSEKQGTWESIANSLLKEPDRRNTSSSSKWKKRCLSLLMLWLLIGGLVIFRIIQLQESNEEYALEAARSRLVLHPPATTVQLLATVPATCNRKTSEKKMGAEQTGDRHEKDFMPIAAPVHADVKKKTAPDNCFNNNYADTTTRQDQQIADTNTISNTVTDAVTASTEQLPKQKKKKQRFRRWQIGLASGLEWSQVKSGGQGKTGLAYGLTIQYRFLRRWSVETGILVAPKLYNSPEWNYKGVMTFMTLQSVDADCRVIDLPLNIRFDILQQARGRFFASAGISSYLMQKEDYTLNYDAGLNPIQVNKKVYNKNRHLFSIVNFATGYERCFNRFSLQATPYLKLPLKVIGEGNLKLISAGMLFSLKYNY